MDTSPQAKNERTGNTRAGMQDMPAAAHGPEDSPSNATSRRSDDTPSSAEGMMRYLVSKSLEANPTDCCRDSDQDLAVDFDSDAEPESEPSYNLQVAFLDTLRSAYSDDPAHPDEESVYNMFFNTLQEYEGGMMDTFYIVRTVVGLFNGKQSLLEQFGKAFLPVDNQLVVGDGNVDVRTPEGITSVMEQGQVQDVGKRAEWIGEGPLA